MQHRFSRSPRLQTLLRVGLYQQTATVRYTFITDVSDVTVVGSRGRYLVSIRDYFSVINVSKCTWNISSENKKSEDFHVIGSLCSDQ